MLSHVADLGLDVSSITGFTAANRVVSMVLIGWEKLQGTKNWFTLRIETIFYPQKRHETHEYVDGKNSLSLHFIHTIKAEVDSIFPTVARDGSGFSYISRQCDQDGIHRPCRCSSDSRPWHGLYKSHSEMNSPIK
jgi:hypothetical protein